MSLLYTANAYGQSFTGVTADEACQKAATAYGVQVASITDVQCNLSYSGSPWGVAGLTVSGTADPVSPPASAPASAPSSGASSSSGSTVVCGAACTVTLQHEIVFPAGDIGVAGMDAGSVVEVLGWGLGFVLLMYVLGMAAGAAVGLIRKI